MASVVPRSSLTTEAQTKPGWEASGLVHVNPLRHRAPALCLPMRPVVGFTRVIPDIQGLGLPGHRILNLWTANPTGDSHAYSTGQAEKWSKTQERPMTPEKLVKSLPAKIRIGGYDVRIALMPRLDSELASVYGQFTPQKQLIEMETGFATNEKVVETFLHEVTHAVYWVAGIKDDDGEERTVTAMGKAWMQIHRDNPWLGKWIEKALR